MFNEFPSTIDRNKNRKDAFSKYELCSYCLTGDEEKKEKFLFMFQHFLLKSKLTFPASTESGQSFFSKWDISCWVESLDLSRLYSPVLSLLSPSSLCSPVGRVYFLAQHVHEESSCPPSLSPPTHPSILPSFLPSQTNPRLHQLMAPWKMLPWLRSPWLPWWWAVGRPEYEVKTVQGSVLHLSPSPFLPSEGLSAGSEPWGMLGAVVLWLQCNDLMCRFGESAKW